MLTALRQFESYHFGTRGKFGHVYSLAATKMFQTEIKNALNFSTLSAESQGRKLASAVLMRARRRDR